MTSALGDIIFLSQTYRRNCEVISRAHYLSSDELRKRHLQLGIPVLIASTFVGTTIFGTLQSEPAIGWKIATGVISIGAALLAGLQTLLNFSERVEKHKSAGASYSAIRRELELFQLRFQHSPEGQRNEALAALEKLHHELTKLGQETPNIPDRHWDTANKGVPAVESPT
jgi:hypothetical protein